MDMYKERKAFEDWVIENLAEGRSMSWEDWCWKTWQAAKAQAVPEGFVAVPKEPTQELLNKMQDFFVGAFENGLTGGQSIHCAYKALIEAQEQVND